jgi:cell division control protein 6
MSLGEPQLLNFNPYQISEISSIIKDRLYSLVEDPSDPFGPPPAPTDNTPPPLIQVPAIELCARKVAASMGDLRTALDVCLQAVELAEREQKKKTAAAGVLGEQKVNTTAVTPAKEPEPKVSIAHVVKVLNTVFGSSGLQKLKQLNLQQKIVMGVFFIMLRSGKNGKKEQFTLGKVMQEAINAKCRMNKLTPSL